MGLIFEKESYLLRGAAFEVYNNLGFGFLERVYQRALAKEFNRKEVQYIEQFPLEILYKGETLECSYRPDFICYKKIIIEIKAIQKLANEHKAQLYNYMKAANIKLGFLFNFGNSQNLEIIRIVI